LCVRFNQSIAGHVVVPSLQRDNEPTASQLQAVLDHAPDAFVSMARDGRIIEWNLQAERMFGWSRAEALGCRVAELIVPPQARRDHEQGLARYLQSGEAHVLNRPIEVQALTKDGGSLPVELTIAVVGDGAGTTFNAFLRDVSERRSHELALREAEEMFRGAFTDASVGMCLATLDGCRWMQVNPALCTLLGYSADDLVGIGFDTVTHPDDIEGNLEGARRLRDGEISAYESEKRYLHADGHLVWVSLSVSLLHDAEGIARCFIAQVLDITARKTADEALATSEERFRLMVQNVEGYAIVMLDAEGHVATWNAGAQRFKGYEAGEIIGRHFSVFYPPEDVAAGKPERELAIAATEGRLEGEGWRVTKDGTRLWANVVITALRDANGTLRGYGKITRDLTQRRTTELQLASQRAALNEAQAIARIGSWSWDPTTDIAGWSDELYRIFGRDLAEGPATAEDLFAYLHPDDRDRFAAGYAKAFGAGEAFELDYRILTGTGELRSLHGLGRRETGGRYVGTVQDVTERKRTERSLRDAEELLALAFDHSPLGMTLSTPDRGLVRLNRAFADMLGYSVQELMANQHPTRYTHPDDHAADRDHVRALVDGEEHYAQWDKRYIHANGHSVWARVSLSVLRHPDGSPRHLVSQIEDISERRQHEAEERALRDVAELVAAGAEPAIVFGAIAGQVRELFDVQASAVVRFDVTVNTGVILGASASDSADLVGTTFDLQSATATAGVFRSGHPSRVDALTLSAGDPMSQTVQRFGLTGSVAAPIQVAGELWGAVAAASEQHIAAGAELRLERFAHLASLAITNLETLETLEHRAATDPLTGIANHRTFHDRLRSEVERARRHGRDLSVVLLDLDHFKAINDTHGHQIGDRILRQVAQRLADEARDGELVARIGGEEFAWVIPESDQHGAYAAAERVRRAIETTPLAGVGTVTLSAGVCSTRHAGDAPQLMRNADRALYSAKEHGRNNTSIYVDAAHSVVDSPGRSRIRHTGPPHRTPVQSGRIDDGGSQSLPSTPQVGLSARRWEDR